MYTCFTSNFCYAKPAPVEDYSFKGAPKKRAVSKPVYQKTMPPLSKKSFTVDDSKPVKSNLKTISSKLDYAIVEKGETVYALSRKYNVTVQELIQYNELKSPYPLVMGQKIKLPKSNYHIVKKGETIYGISRTYDMDMNQLVALNHIKKPYSLSIGQQLMVNKKTIISTSSKIAKKKQPIQIASFEKNESIQQKKISSVQNNHSTKNLVSKQPLPKRSNYFSWPVKGSVISNYGPKQNGMHNDGINIKAPLGSPVSSAENGIVEYVGGMKGFDNLVIIKHEHYMTAYAHLEKISVNRGALINKGQTIGTVGKKANIPQIHFEIRKGKKAINPVTLLR